jgi:hypothetical protein
MSTVEERLTLIEEDLDCDVDGSLAEAIGDLRDELADLRARIEEWVPRAADGLREAA